MRPWGSTTLTGKVEAESRRKRGGGKARTEIVDVNAELPMQRHRAAAAASTPAVGEAHTTLYFH